MAATGFTVAFQGVTGNELTATINCIATKIACLVPQAVSVNLFLHLSLSLSLKCKAETRIWKKVNWPYIIFRRLQSNRFLSVCLQSGTLRANESTTWQALKHRTDLQLTLIDTLSISSYTEFSQLPTKLSSLWP